jgi:taurine dioxygenase
MLKEQAGRFVHDATAHTQSRADYADFSVEPLTGSIGGVVTGIHLSAVDDSAAREIRSALTDFGVLVFPQQNITVDQQRDFAAMLGQSFGHPVREFIGVRSGDVVDMVENDANKPPQAGGTFHTDYSFNNDVPELAILRAEVVPSRGGDTVWSSTFAAYDGLSDPIKVMIGDLAARHEAHERFWFEYSRVYGDDLAMKARREFSGCDHPVVAGHPLSGRPLLYVDSYTTHIVGLSPRESRAILNMLWDELNYPGYHYRHKWSVGDVVMWDEHATVHMGPHDFYPEHRRLTRITAGRVSPTRVLQPV